MISIDPGNNFNTWREASRRLLSDGVHPHEVIWESDAGLFADQKYQPRKAGTPTSSVPKSFVDLAKNATCHNDPKRWSLLYNILWRITVDNERHLLAIPSDPDVSQARTMEKEVRREIHKMHAFVRFRKIGENPEGREQFVAWFEPDHYIIEAGSTFFRKRFANMDWSIFTPKGCAHWDGSELGFSEGVAHNPCDNPDEIEDIWRTYYKSTFNPARLKVKMMQTEMPKRYWKNLPEADLIEELIRETPNKVREMVEKAPLPVKKQPKIDYLEKLSNLPS